MAGGAKHRNLLTPQRLITGEAGEQDDLEHRRFIN
jgi:hypothetical protein